MSPIFFERLNAFLLIFDLQNDHMIWANDYYFQATGSRRNYSQGTPLDSFLRNIHPNDRVSFMNVLENNKRGMPNGHTLIYRIKAKSGSWLWVFSHFSIYNLPKKSTAYYVNYATEIDCSGLRKQLSAMLDEDNDCYRSILLKALTKREQEVFHLIVNGNTNKEISEKLNISIHTAKTHRKRIIHKLGIKNSTALIKSAIEHGMN